MDYRMLLVKYMRLVISESQVSYVGFLSPSNKALYADLVFSEEELAALQACEAEARPPQPEAEPAAEQGDAEPGA